MYVLVIIAMGLNRTPTAIATVPGFNDYLACTQAERDLKTTAPKIVTQCIQVK